MNTSFPEHRMLKAETALAHKFGTKRPLFYRAPFGAIDWLLSLSAGTTMGAATGALEFYERPVAKPLSQANGLYRRYS